MPCDRCEKPENLCVCDRLPTVITQTRVLVLMHPREKNEPLSTVPLLRAALPNAIVKIGLSWPSLSAAVGEKVVAAKWAVVFPDPAHGDPTKEVSFLDRRGEAKAGSDFEGIILLDGSWKEAKALRWRNPWLRRLPRVSLRPKQPSIYGKMRREPRREWISTLEAVALTFDGLGEDPEVAATLRRALRTLVQKARDSSS